MGGACGIQTFSLVLATFSFFFPSRFYAWTSTFWKQPFNLYFLSDLLHVFFITICSLWNDFFLISSPFNFFHLSNLVSIFLLLFVFFWILFLNWIYFSISPFNIFFILFLCQIWSLFFLLLFYYFGNFFRFKYFILFFNIKFIRK